MADNISTVSSTGAALPAWQLWTGRVLSALPVLLLAMSASMKFSQATTVTESFVGKLGFPAGLLITLGIIEVTCTIIYLIPRTAVLGAVLLTGYLGGAMASHLRVGDSVAMPFLCGVLLWGGLFLRDARVRALLPLRRSTVAS